MSLNRSSAIIVGIVALFALADGFLAFGAEQASASEADNERVRSIFQAAIANPDDPTRVEEFIRELPEVPPGSGRYIVEGDIRLNRAEIVPYLKSFSKTSVEAAKSGELIVNLGPNGKFDYWKDPNSRHLTFAVDRNSFLTDAQADEVELILPRRRAIGLTRARNAGLRSRNFQDRTRSRRFLSSVLKMWPAGRSLAPSFQALHPMNSCCPSSLVFFPLA